MRHDLAPGERVILRSRPQARALVWPFVLFLAVVAACAFVEGWFTRHGQELGDPWNDWVPAFAIAAAVLAVIVVVRLGVRPLMRWAGTRYVLTSRRLIARRGFSRRREEHYPLVAIVHLGSSQSLPQQMLRSGNITLDMGHYFSSRFVDVPEVSRFQNIVLQTIEQLPQTAMYDGARFDDGFIENGWQRWSDEAKDGYDG